MSCTGPLHGDGVLLGDGILAEVGVMTIGHLVILLGVHPGRSYGPARSRSPLRTDPPPKEFL